MVRMVRRMAPRCIVVAALALMLAGAAHAYTRSQALAKARSEQNFDCRWGSLVVYRCREPFAVFPDCVNTGVDRPAYPQFLCGGVFFRQNRIFGGRWQRCDTIFQLSPWGRVLNHRTFVCYRL